ncbi:MAG TPA: GAF domain-containing protein [Bacteroidales bacterium]|nr:GAF domain-containing protein [Bacteroidales bacterium]
MRTEATYSSKVSEIQSFLLSYSWVDSGKDFFQALAEYLAELLNADYICIDRLHGRLEAETVAVWYDGHFDDNYKYRLADTPCGQVVADEVCAIPEKVRFLFPKDEFLQQMNAESYAGITLRDSYGRPSGLIAVISRTPADDMLVIEAVLKQVAIRASAELEHRKTLRSFQGLSMSAHAILTATDESALMQQVCSIIVDYCGYSLMWIGMVNEDTGMTITPVASAGFEEGYLERLNLTYADTDRGRGPSGTAARTAKPVICGNLLDDPTFAPWRKDAMERGYASNMALPMVSGGKVIGVVSVYAATPHYFHQQELQVMTRFTNDLATGIMSIRLRAERDRTLHELNMTNELLEVMVKERTAILTETNQKLREEIESRKQKEKQLLEAELKYRTVADFTYDGETWLGTKGQFIYVSPSFERLTGYPADVFIFDSSMFYKIVHPDDREKVENHFFHTMTPNCDVCNMHFRIITKSGKTRWIGHACQPVFNPEGDWIGQRGSNRDITFEKQAEETLIGSFRQLRALTNRLDEIAEQERKNVAHYIHDELGHLLTALKFDLDNIAELKQNRIGDLEEEFRAVDLQIAALINAVRKISSELRPEIIDHLGLLPALEWQVKEFTKRTRICCNIKMDDLKYSFSSKETTVIYRILQEILTNIARHSEAKHVTILVIEKEKEFVLRVTDNGKGFNCEENGSDSLGVLGMKERALIIGGSLTIASTPGKGTTVTFALPLNHNSTNDNNAAS